MFLYETRAGPGKRVLGTIGNECSVVTITYGFCTNGVRMLSASTGSMYGRSSDA